MPTKFKPSQQIRDRQTGKITTQHFWMKGMHKDELFEYVNSSNGKPKIKQKCRNELDRRGIKLEWVTKES